MTDRKVKVGTLVVGTCWLVAVALIGVSLLPGVPVQVGLLGVLAGGVGQVLHIRWMLAVMTERELRAFETGRKSVRAVR
jgi:hypothetical protein